MGLLDLFFKDKKQPPQYNYAEAIARSWDIFRQGLKNPNPEIRRAVEEAVWFIDTPEGKRFFAAGMQEPDIENKAFCLQKLYERGGWRLSENILKIAYEDDSLNLEEREKLIYFIGGFSDPASYEFLELGLQNNELRLRVATLCAMAGIKSSEAAVPILTHLTGVKEQVEKFACGLVLYQYNKPEGKALIDEIFSSSSNPPVEYLKKLDFLDFNKARIYFDKFRDSSDPEVKKTIISMINDNRGIDLIKNYLADENTGVAKRAVEQVTEIGSRSVLEIIRTLENKPGLEKTVQLALAAFSDKPAIDRLEEKARKSTLEEENLEDLKVLGMIQDQNISEIIDKLLEPISSLDTISKDETEKVNKAVQILIKYGKMSSIPVVSRYCLTSYLENEDILRWKISCNSAAAVLCIVERNTTFYTLHKKNKD